MKRTYYMHTMGGRAAYFNQHHRQIFNVGHRGIRTSQMVASIDRLRSQQKMSANAFGVMIANAVDFAGRLARYTSRFGYIRIVVDE